MIFEVFLMIFEVKSEPIAVQQERQLFFCIFFGILLNTKEIKKNTGKKDVSI